MLRQIFTLIFLFNTLIDALSIHGLKTLVVFDDRLTDLQEYAAFFDSLETRSYTLDFISVTSNTSKIQLYSNEKRLYDNLILFPIKSKRTGKTLTADTLLKFFQEGGDILTITSPHSISNTVFTFTNQLGIYPSPNNYILLDHFQNQQSNVIELTTENLKNKYVYAENSLNLTYKGSAALLDNRELIVPILTAPRSSYAKNINGNDNWSMGSQSYVAAGFQNLNNARVVWIGSDEFFNNKNYDTNGLFIAELTKWNFREKAVIKTTGFSHSHVNGKKYEESVYKIKDDIIYEIGLSQWNGQRWIPFVANDVQFELRMIDPYYRLTLNLAKSTSETQFYTTGIFKLPDHHGVFTFITQYKRAGLSFVEEKDIKTVRHLANNEYPRSWEIVNAWVYLTSIYSVIAAFILFSICFITSSNSKVVSNSKKRD